MGTHARGRGAFQGGGTGNNVDRVEKAAAAREAREAVGSAQRHPGSRTDEVAAALKHYLSTEQYHQRAEATPDTDDDERRG